MQRDGTWFQGLHIPGWPGGSSSAHQMHMLVCVCVRVAGPWVLHGRDHKLSRVHIAITLIWLSDCLSEHVVYAYCCTVLTGQQTHDEAQPQTTDKDKSRDFFAAGCAKGLVKKNVLYAYRLHLSEKPYCLEYETNCRSALNHVCEPHF